MNSINSKEDNPKGYTPRRIIIKLLRTKDKEKNLESNWRNTPPYIQGKNNLNHTRLLIRKHGGQKEVANISEALTAKNRQPRILYPVKTIFRNEEPI